MVVPLTPGSGADIAGRLVSKSLAELWKQPVIIENRPGAGGLVGTGVVVNAAPDGYTLLVQSASYAANPAIYKKLPYDLKSLTDLNILGTTPYLLIVSAESPYKSIKDLVAAAKAKPGDLPYASAGIGSSTHLAAEYFNQTMGIKMLHVPYRGSAGYTQDLLGGELNVGFMPVHIAQGFVKNGRLNALALGSTKRHSVAPDVPTFDEVGVKGVDVDLWYAFFAPSKTPAAVVTRLNTEMAAILRQNEVQEILGKAGMVASASTPNELTAIVARDYPRWGNVIRSKQISAD
jgi:tripartite-type tricarboxylate transporter receptor subunit TctC